MRSRPAAPWSAGVAAAACLVVVVLLSGAASSGCGSGGNAGSAEETRTIGARMAGPVVDVNVTPEALASKPKPWVLSTPESAVRSYVDWVSYAYRIGQSEVAEPTMTSYEEVRISSYVQYNIQKSRLLDQTLESIEFGTPSVEGTRAVLPAKEKWKYRYVSIEIAGKTIGGPYSQTYEATYTLVRNEQGDWVVDSVDAKAAGKVK